MTLRKLKIIGLLLAFIISLLIYNLYNLMPNFIVSIIAPSNNNITEYSKVLFSGVMFSGVIQKIIIILFKLDFKNNCFSNFIGAIISIIIFLSLYLPIYFIVGHNYTIKIIFTILSIIIAEIISYILMNKKDYKLENKTILFVIFTYIVFYFLIFQFNLN